MKYTYNDLLSEIQKIPPHRRDTSISTYVDEGDDDTYFVLSKEELCEEQGVEHQADIKTNDFEIDDILDDDGGFTWCPEEEKDTIKTTFPELRLKK